MTHTNGALPKPCKPRCEPDTQKYTKGIIRSEGELVSAWKEMVMVSFGKLSRHWSRKTKEQQENFQSGQFRSQGPELSLGYAKHETGRVRTRPRPAGDTEFVLQ